MDPSKFSRVSWLRRRSRQRGLSTVEYVIVLVLIAAVAIGAWRLFGDQVRRALGNATSRLEGLSAEDLGTGGPGGTGAPGGGTPGGTGAPGGGAPGTSPTPPPSVTSGLGGGVDGLASQSPALSQQIQTLQTQGWNIRFSQAGETGSFTDRRNQTVVIDSNFQNNPTTATSLLSHEVGHALYPLSLPSPSGLTRAEYVTRTTNAQLADEGAATLSNAIARDQLLASGKPDIGILGAQASTYDSIYNQYKSGAITRAQAEQQIGQAYGNGERTSTTGQPYQQYYQQSNEARWDSMYPNQPPTFRAP